MRKRSGTVAARLVGALLLAGVTSSAISPNLVLAAPSEERQESVLRVGDPAPPLRVSKWIKGEPIASMSERRVTVVEFWATWCAPCIANMPHLSELQAKYADKGLRIVGVDVWEQDPARLEPFMKRMGDRMAYTVAVDDVPPMPEGTKNAMDWWREKGAMASSYLTASSAPGIPYAFIVNGDGVVAWIGNPGDPEFDAALERVIAGTWDLEAAAASFNERFVIDRACAEFETLYKRGRISEAQERVRDLVPTIGEARSFRLASIANALGDPASADKGADLDLALRAAERAVELTDRRDSFSLAALARVLATRGDAQAAVRVQREAIEATEDQRYRDYLGLALREYEAASTEGH